jgi:hypothetical protein
MSKLVKVLLSVVTCEKALVSFVVYIFEIADQYC